jgi:hypothetical protein
MDQLDFIWKWTSLQHWILTSCQVDSISTNYYDNIFLFIMNTLEAYAQSYCEKQPLGSGKYGTNSITRRVRLPCPSQGPA